jgi:hypothetical protein
VELDKGADGVNAKRGSLSNFTIKPTAPATPSPAEEPKDRAPRVALTLRLPRDAWHQLGELALELSKERDGRVQKHDIIVEALNEYFRRHGRPPLA